MDKNLVTDFGLDNRIYLSILLCKKKNKEKNTISTIVHLYAKLHQCALITWHLLLLDPTSEFLLKGLEMRLQIFIFHLQTSTFICQQFIFFNFLVVLY